MKVVDHILSKAKIAFALINHNLELGDHNDAFLDICSSTEKDAFRTKQIFDLIPEFIGLENQLKKISSGNEKLFNIPYLNRGNKAYNCCIESYTDSKTPLLITFQEITEQASLKQKLSQKENEINILKAQLSTQNKIALSEIIGESAAIQKIKMIVPRIGKIETSRILLEGETGTGKSMLAQVIHNSSSKINKPFVEINCAAIPETLLEAELFGNIKGAFTNAVADRIGLIESANGGTLFLDEISELPLNLQAKLLSFLETRKFRQLGSNKEKMVQLRLIAATNKGLAKCVEEGTFREDLFYRLNVVLLTLPALREMENDLILLANHFIANFNMLFNKKVKNLSASATKKLLNHSWPGNVRELSNCIEQAMIFAESETLEADDFVIRKNTTIENKLDYNIPSSGIDLEKMEIEFLKSALTKSNGNKSNAAKLLGLSRDTLRYRLEKYNIS
ncbi:MAG: AAA family ATPase [Calditrichaeota bacterium]|nr:MAG: AAA family ATPase [Calditrichota bacterium]MBL1206020.1 AAA family ATPase [Calditrichota bacterium]NOG45848.1 sigma 54-interacting transcriptional regulator [Calditrichota bacterium]